MQNEPCRPQYNLLVLLLGELAANGRFKLLEIRMHLQRWEEQGQLSEHLPPNLIQLVCRSPRNFHVSQCTRHGTFHCCVNHTRVVGQKIKCRAEVFAEPVLVRERARKHRPEEGNKGTSGDSCETIRSDFIKSRQPQSVGFG